MTADEMEKESICHHRVCSDSKDPADRRHYELIGNLWAIGAEIVRRLDGDRHKDKHAVASASLILETCCPNCDYDEATGTLVNHCDACCRKIVRDTWGTVMETQSISS